MERENEQDGAEILEAELREALALADDGQVVDAFERLRASEADYPDDPMLLCTLGALAQQLELGEAAYTYFRRCLAAQPTDPTLLVTAGSGLAAFDDPEAEPALRLAALTAPSLPLARLRYGAYLAREGLLPQAIEELEAARALDEAAAEARVELGRAYILADRMEAAVEELGASLALGDDDGWIRGLRALAMLEAGQEEEACEELYHVATERVEDGELQVAAALACAARGWDGEAWAALARAEAAIEFGRDDLLLEVEEAIELGADAAVAMLRQDVAPSLLRDRVRRDL